MTWRDTVRTGVDSVRHHRLRSALTMLGILIGIAAVILTVGLGRGAQAEVQSQIDALGTNLLVVSPGSSTDTETGVRGGFGSATTLTTGDADALASEAAPDIAAVAPVTTTSLSLAAGDTTWTTNLVGTTAAWTDVRAREVAEGRFLPAEDAATTAAVVVLAPDTAEELFGSAAAAVGQEVTANGVTLEVVGVLEASGSSDESNEDDQALVPLSTASQRLVGGTDRDALSTIYLSATTSETLTAAYQEATSILLTRHGLGAAEADFTIADQRSLLSTSEDVDQTLTVLLGGIAGIALLVGGIGVMNIMLVSVTERIREIGLRKALGARPALIRRQFLVEASVLGLAGGVLGVLVGLGGAATLPRLADTPVVLSLPPAVAAIALATAIALVFGVYPASRAARLAPIDALRSE
ncbi:MAG TPA: ABC transporter permease [Iamia sp.]|nr:ABC transporter permease [Iamia sp.]